MDDPTGRFKETFREEDDHLNQPISTFNSATDTTPKRTTAQAILQAIQGDRYQAQVQRLRTLKQTDKALYDEEKKKLPAVTFSGEFRERKKSALIAHSGLIIADIDDVPAEAIQVLKDKICQDSYTFACFLSPSAQGLKVLVKVDGSRIKNDTDHKAAFQSVEKYFKETFGIDLDPSGKDVCRLCFVSWDPELYHNEDAAPLPIIPVEPKRTPLPNGTLRPPEPGLLHGERGLSLAKKKRSR